MRILTIGICKSSEFEYVLWQTKNMSALLESAYLLVLLTTWQWPFKIHQSWYCWASIFLRGLKRTRATGPTAISDEAYLANGPFNPSPGDSRFRCIKIDFVKKKKENSFFYKWTCTNNYTHSWYVHSTKELPYQWFIFRKSIEIPVFKKKSRVALSKPLITFLYFLSKKKVTSQLSINAKL